MTAAWSTSWGRRISAGHSPMPGALARLPAWWGARRWVDVDVSCGLTTRPDWLREEHVARDTVLAVARAHARYADHKTGRGCRPTNERLAAELQLSVRQLQRARRLLRRLRLVVEVVRGRSIMTRAERLAAWRRGSSHRRLAAEFALTGHRHHDKSYPQRGAPCPQAHPPPVEGVTPPRGAWVDPPTSRKLGFLTGKDRTDEPLRGRNPRARAARPITPAQVRTRRLIAGVQSRLGWLRATSPRRLSSLHRFAQHGWTPLDVNDALTEVLRARGWSIPDRVERPAAYLAALLRDVDPADRPGALREAAWADELERRRRQKLIDLGDEQLCPHGEPHGAQPIPGRAYLRCPSCRRSTT